MYIYIYVYIYTEYDSQKEKYFDDSIIKNKSAFKPPRKR